MDRVGGRWLTLSPVVPQRNPYSWNKYADGKLQFYNKELESLVRSQQDRAVQEFWRLLAICHTVMVQEKDSEWSGVLPLLTQPPGPRGWSAHLPSPSGL